MKRIAYAAFALCATTWISLSAQTLTTLYSSDNPAGSWPLAALVQATNGEFYGTTSAGGANPTGAGYGPGTTFKITTSGVITTLYNFCPLSRCADGFGPYGGLVEAANGDFYGTVMLGPFPVGGTYLPYTLATR